MNLSRNQNRGITLMELVIASALLGIVGLSFGFIYTTAQRFLIQTSNFTGSQGESSFAMEHMKKYLLLATTVTSPAAPGTLNLNPGPLTFTWQPTIADPVITSKYQLAGTNLQFDRTNSGAWVTIASNITTATVTRTAQNGFDIIITAQLSAGNDVARQTTSRTMVNPRAL